MPDSSEMAPLRCHLLIGPPASGKSTLAAVLAEQIGAVVLSPDALREELFGDAGHQGPWPEIEAELHQRLKKNVAAGTPVILDATHCQRPWRLAITQALELPAPVQWIAWWLTTPLKQCLAWNQQRQRQVEEGVITRMHANLPAAVYEPADSFLEKLNRTLAGDPDFKDKREEKLRDQAKQFLGRQRNAFREEGFAHVIAINPAAGDGSLVEDTQSELDAISGSIANAANRRSKIELHRYSRILDLERLIFLIRLLLEFPGVELFDPRVGEELRKSFRFAAQAPLPEEEDCLFATRCAFALHHRHGPCYGDENAIAEDLHWLKEEKFVTLADLPVQGPIEPGEPCERVEQMKDAGAGFPAAADRHVFQRQLGLLRHLLHNPFDHPTASSFNEPYVKPLKEVVQEARKQSETVAHEERSMPGRQARNDHGLPREFIPSLRVYLLFRLRQLDVADYSSNRRSYQNWEIQPDAPQLRTLDKDLELLIKGYGFTTIHRRDHGQN